MVSIYYASALNYKKNPKADYLLLYINLNAWLFLFIICGIACVLNNGNQCSLCVRVRACMHTSVRNGYQLSA